MIMTKENCTNDRGSDKRKKSYTLNTYAQKN